MLLDLPLHHSAGVAISRSRTSVALATLLLATLIVAPFTQLPAQAKGASKGLAPPKNLWAAQTSPRELTVVWDTVPGATEYHIYASVGGASGAMGLNRVARVVRQIGRPFIRYVLDLLRLIPGPKGVSLQIQAADAAGALSAMVAFNTVVPVAKAATPARVPPPANVVAAETAPGLITLTWDPVPDATAYALGRSVWPDGLRSFCALCPTQTTYVDSGLTQGVQHSYSVIAITANGNSTGARSNMVTPGGGGVKSNVLTSGGTTTTSGGPVATLPPKGPTNPKAVLMSPDSVELTWTPDPKATEYVIERSINGGAFQQLSRLPGNIQRLIDALLPLAGGTPLGSVAYRIAASNAKGTSPAVAFNPITISAPKGNPLPTGVTKPASAVTSASSISLSWTPDPAATSYRIERSLSGGPFQLLANLPGAVPSYVDALSGLVKQNPKYRIFSVNSAGMSPAVAVP